MKEMKRVLALLLCAVMLIGNVPVGALAAEVETTAPSVIEETQATEVTETVAEPTASEIETTASATTEAATEAATEASEEETEAVTEAAEETFEVFTGEEITSWSAARSGETVLDAAIFCSDVHGSTSDLTSVLGGVVTSGVDYSAIGFVGDTCLTVANTTSTVNSALGYTPAVMFSYAASHDTENSADISTNWNYSGEVGGVSDYYLVYTIRETDMQNSSDANTAAPAFTTWYNGLTKAEKALPIFIMSHRPLHARRNDNAGAAAWYEVISAAAETSDIVFFWAHNHTQESSVDTAAYYVEKDGSETITVYNGDTVVPNFTYMNAGYINANGQNPARKGIATTVHITADSLIFQDYNSSGAYTGTYAHNVTVTRDNAAEEETTTPETSEPVEESYINSIAVTTQPTKTTYDVGEELDTTGMVVTATYSDGTTAEVTGWYTSYVDMSTAGEKTVTVNYADNGFTFNTTFKITVEEQISEDATLTALEITTEPAKTEYLLSEALDITGMVVEATFSDGTVKELSYGGFASEAATVADLYYNIESFNMYVAKEQNVVVTFTYGDVTRTDTFTINVWAEDFTDETTGVKVHVSGDYGVTSATVKESTNENVATAIADVIKGTNYVAYDIELAFDEGYSETATTKTVTLPIPENVTNPVVYYVSDNGATVTNMNATKGDGVVTFETTHFSTYIVGESTEITVPNPTTQTVTGATTTEEKDVYVLVSTPTAGNQYIIVSGNSAGSAYALKENTTTGTSVTINAAGNGISAAYIETSDETIMWNAASGMTFRSETGSYYLRQSNSNGSRSLTFSTSQSTNWTVRTNTLTYKSNNSNTTYYVKGGSTWSLSSNSANVYFYEKQTVTVTTSANGTYSIAGNPAEVSKVVVNGTTADLSSTLTFTSTSGTATTMDVSDDAVYAVVTVDANGNTVDGDPNGIISGISGNTVTFSGNYGTALVKVSYTKTISGTDYTVDNYITVTATEPTYAIEITETEVDEDGNRGAGEVITETIVIKGETAIAAGYDLWADVTYTTADGVDESYVLDADKLTWSSNNTSIATVDGDGIVTFTGNEGAVQITVYYEYADGKRVTDTVTFSVSKSQYIVPEDGTDDFPEYPNQGAIRIDKTATAVGSFSQTGIAQVELSMTGVPYGTSTKTDVVIMVDMTASMEDNDVTAAESAVKELVETLVYDEENDKYDSNIQLFLDVFYSARSDSDFETEEYFNCLTISSASELSTALAAIDFAQSSQGGGTRYNLAMKDVYETLNRDGHADNQFVVFVSDGVPTAYAPLTDGALGTTITGSNSDTASLAAGWFDDDGEVTDKFKTEYYSYLIKTAGIPIYTVGANLTDGSDAADLLNHMSSNYSPDGKTSTGETEYSFTCTTSGGITDDVLEIFHNIGASIKEAATNVVVEDKIADEYSMNFSLPSGVTSDEAGMSQFYIQVVGYTLDENHERTSNPEVIEKFLFSADGTSVTHSIGTTTCGDSCTHVTWTDGVVTAISGTYFSYSAEIGEDGLAANEVLTWTADKLDTTELALQYFVYLDNSAGLTQEQINAGQQIAAGTYPTNEYATITYTNYLDHEVQKEFPVPSLTWNGAQVTYLFYLVNENGQPVNRAGKVVPFAEAVYVTDPVTYDVTWNEEAGSENILAENLFASAKVPDVYELYDTDAAYTIRVYQTENVDSNGVNGNYFQIAGASDKLIDSEIDTDTTADNSTTKVFNTKVGTKYDEYGIYSIYDVGTTLTDGTNYITTTVKTTDIDYANTTVAFAVVWKPALVEDTVVVDYGLDVVIDVYTNDGLAAGVTGVMTSAPSGVTINSGSYTTAVGQNSVTSTDGLWTASKESLTSVRFKQNEIGLNAPATFYYEAGVNYYTYDASNNATLKTTNMYSSVTVIPATTVYYEDEFVDLKTFTKGEDGTYTVTDGWDTNSVDASATQDVDRPGVSEAMSSAWDANNVYGYDSAYDTTSMFSMGNAAKTTVRAGKYATAEFEFYGTGFDIFSVTSNMTGTITVKVKDEEGTQVRSILVDTYYGYERNTDGEWVVSANSENALYQVPVISVDLTEDCGYDKYSVTIKAAYNDALNHADDSEYDLYLDAIRIYNPTGNANSTANEAYTKDVEGWPKYQELREALISANDFDAVKDDAQTSGVIFIDHTAGEYTIEDYENYGPNHETYLAKNQAVSFDLDLSASPYVAANDEGINESIVADIQVGIKSADGNPVKVTMTTIQDGNEKESTAEIKYATEMYYSIGSNVDLESMKTLTLVFENSSESDNIVSITNIKVTFTEAPTTSNEPLATWSRRSANSALAALSAVEEEETVPETTVPEETEPEATEPEITVPEEVLDADISVNIRNKSVKVGSTVVVKVSTSDDVDALTVNGKEVSKYTENSQTGKRTWTTTVKAEQAGDLDVVVTAYTAEGVAIETVTETIEVTGTAGVVQQIVGQLLGWLLG